MMRLWKDEVTMAGAQEVGYELMPSDIKSWRAMRLKVEVIFGFLKRIIDDLMLRRKETAQRRRSLE